MLISGKANAYKQTNGNVTVINVSEYLNFDVDTNNEIRKHITYVLVKAANYIDSIELETLSSKHQIGHGHTSLA